MPNRQQTPKQYDSHKADRRKKREADGAEHRADRAERAAAGERDRRRAEARRACRGRFSYDD